MNTVARLPSVFPVAPPGCRGANPAYFGMDSWPLQVCRKILQTALSACFACREYLPPRPVQDVWLWSRSQCRVRN